MTRAAALAVVAALAACDLEDHGFAEACVRDEDCATGYVCDPDDELCVPPTDDDDDAGQ